MENVKVYLDFSIDFGCEVESVNLVEKNGVDVTDKVEEKKIQEFVGELMEIEDFIVSDHRTEIQVWIYENTMDVNYRIFNSPSDDDFDEGVLRDIPRTHELSI